MSSLFATANIQTFLKQSLESAPDTWNNVQYHVGDTVVILVRGVFSLLWACDTEYHMTIDRNMSKFKVGTPLDAVKCFWNVIAQKLSNIPSVPSRNGSIIPCNVIHTFPGNDGSVVYRVFTMMSFNLDIFKAPNLIVSYITTYRDEMIDIKHVRDNEICQEYHVRADTKDIYLNMVYPYKTPFVKIDVPLLTKWMIAYSTETYNNYAAMITPYLAPICLTIAKAPTILTPSNVSSCVLTPIAHSVVPKTVTKYRALINNDKSALTASAPARVMSTDIKQPPVEYQLPPPLAPKITFVHVTPKEAAEKKLSPPRLVPSQPAKKREIEQEQSTARPQATLDEQLAYAVLCVDYGKKPDAEELNKLVTQNIESNPEDPRGANKKINNFSLDLNELESTAHRDKRQRAGAE